MTVAVDPNVQRIAASAGDAELTWPVTLVETNGKDIHADTVTVNLSTSSTTPATFVTPTVKTNPTTSSVLVQLLVPASTTPGTYYLFVKIVDGTETIVRRVLTVYVT